MISIYGEKEKLRREFIQKRLLLSREEVEDRSKNIVKGIIKNGFTGFKIFLFYVPIRNEVNLLPLAKTLFSEGRVILFPKIINYEKIVPYIVRDINFDFKRGAYGIPEPDTQPFYSDIDVVFVPGVVFGKNGYRIGYGKHFYDDFLSSFSIKVKIGVGYDFQLIENVPFTEKDVRLDFIQTESFLYKIDK
jgi:5-formyltetrahydrofolate cyclo-ligase